MTLNNKGQTLILALVAGTIAVIIGGAITKMMEVHSRAERGIASNADLTQFFSTIDSILMNNDTCKKSGLLGLTVNPSPAPSSSSTPNPTPSPWASTETVVKIYLPGIDGPGTLYAQEGSPVGVARQVTYLRFVSLMPLSGGAGRMDYFSTLHIDTQIVGKAMTLRNPSKDFHLRLTLDDTNKILGCSGIATSFGVTPGSCPLDQAVVGFDSTGQTICAAVAPPAPAAGCDPTHFSCLNKRRYVTSTTNLVFHPLTSLRSRYSIHDECACLWNCHVSRGMAPGRWGRILRIYCRDLGSGGRHLGPSGRGRKNA